MDIVEVDSLLLPISILVDALRELGDMDEDEIGNISITGQSPEYIVTGWKFGCETPARPNIYYITPTIIAENASLGLIPLGNGAIVGTLDGECRGLYAVDLQLSREQRDQVALGDYSAIVGGESNKVTGNYSVTMGGRRNLITDQYSSILGGQENHVAGISSVILGGYQNDISEIDYTFNANNSVIGGLNNRVSGTNDSIIGGHDNVVSASESSIIVGYGNSIRSDRSIISGGLRNRIEGSQCNSISGGYDNYVYGSNSSIIGGHNNTGDGNNIAIVGGLRNTVNGSNIAIVGGLRNTVSAECASAIGGRYLHVNTDNMVTIGQYNETTNTNRPDTTLDGNVKQFSNNGGTIHVEDLTSGNRGTVAFSIGNGTAEDSRRDVFLVTNEGTTWTRRAYTCSFGSDYAEIFPLSDSSPVPKAGDLISLHDTGDVSVYDTSHSQSSIIGIVTTTPTLVGEGRSLLMHQRDPDTLQLILDSDGNPVSDPDYQTTDTVKEVTVGLVGRVLLKDKWLQYMPSRWIALKNSPQTKKYTGYTYVLIR